MKLEIRLPAEETPELKQKYLDALYETNNSFNFLIRKEGKLVACARGEKDGNEGFVFTMMRLVMSGNGKTLEDLKDCDVEVRTRCEDALVRTFKFDNLTRTSRFNELSVTAKVF